MQLNLCELSTGLIHLSSVAFGSLLSSILVRLITLIFTFMHKFEMFTERFCLFTFISPFSF
jgi:hypothetical protein